MIALCILTDGRKDCFNRTLASLTQNLTGTIGRWLIINDSTDNGYRSYLDDFLGFEIHHTPQRRGFAGTYHYAWSVLAQMDDVDHCCTWEDDFVLLEPVNLDHLAGTLDRHSHLDQLALLRQPWNETEKDAGGIMEANPADFSPCHDLEAEWVEHRRFFTTNPSVYHRSLCDVGWPQGEHSEGRFTHQRLSDPDRRFGYWGRLGQVMVEHIGSTRTGTGY